MPSPTERSVYAVSELTEILRALLENALPSVWVQGEISNFSRPASGHWYFTLKDARAQLRCAMFKGQNFYVRPQPKDGDAVLLRARVGVYPARGELQLVVEHLEAAGTGALLRAFEALKAKLAAEGLFDAAIKRPIPAAPRVVGLVTSGTGAALHDMLNALGRRWPLATVLLYPVPVQGPEAVPAIVRALADLPARAARRGLAVDTLLLARGGGSIEDLWSFNHEAVARAIRACAVPVVSGIGHEIDFTIADFAADLRAATPTAAAELATPDIADWAARAAQALDRLDTALQRQQRERGASVDRAQARLRSLHPGRRLAERAQRLDELDERLRHALSRRLGHCTERLARAAGAFAAIGTARRIATLTLHERQLDERLRERQRQRLHQARARLATADALLASFNPQAVLDRGYAVATVKGRVVRDAATLALGEALQVRFACGEALTQVRRITKHLSRKTS